VSSSAAPVDSVPLPGSSPDRTIGLQDEARHIVRERLAPLSAGVGLGTAFVIIGAYELVALRSSFPSADTLVAGLVVVIGISLWVLTVRASLVNPVVRVRIDGEGLLLSRRWGREIRLAWSDPEFEVEFQDLAPDRESTPEQKQHIFFTTSGPCYGSFSRTDVGPLLDAARNHGLAVRMWHDTPGGGRAPRKIRRVRISPSSSDAT
jgi:hypothetical protein